MTIETRTGRVVPNCRYGHGDLQQVIAEYKEVPEQVRFAWVASRKPETMFVGKIYTCAQCGYTEFFDDEPAVTASMEGAAWE